MLGERQCDLQQDWAQARDPTSIFYCAIVLPSPATFMVLGKPIEGGG